MRIIAMSNSGQLPMMKNMLNSALNTGFPMDLLHCYIIKEESPAAKYQTPAFTKMSIKKLEIILLNMELDSEILWIDNDIVFFENIISNVKSIPGDFVIQDDVYWSLETSYCTGFFLVRSSEHTKQLIRKCIDWVKESNTDEIVRSDQRAFNTFASSMSQYISIKKLSAEEYPIGCDYFDKNIRSNAKMVHNNWLFTTSEKIDRFKKFNMWDESDSGLNKTNKYFI
jgi:hypothetical protein